MKYLKEIIILVIQLFMFYIFPLFAGPTDTMGMVVLTLVATMMLSILIAVLSDKKIKYFYPIIIAVLFIPTIFIYYNTSALIYIVWYLVDSAIGILVGTFIYKILKRA